MSPLPGGPSPQKLCRFWDVSETFGRGCDTAVHFIISNRLACLGLSFIVSLLSYLFTVYGLRKIRRNP